MTRERSVRFHELGGPEVLRLEALPVGSVEEVGPLEQIVAAHRYLEASEQVGKVVVLP